MEWLNRILNWDWKQGWNWIFKLMCYTQIRIVFYILITPQLLSLRKIIYKSFNVSYLFYGPRKSTFFAIENECWHKYFCMPPCANVCISLWYNPQSIFRLKDLHIICFLDIAKLHQFAFYHEYMSVLISLQPRQN